MTEQTQATTDPNTSTSVAAPADATFASAQSMLGDASAQAQAAPTEGETATTETTPIGAPESYQFTAPEGQSYDPKVLDGFSEAMKDLNIPQDKAQATLDKLAPLIANQMQEAVQKQSQQWADQVRSDPEIGGQNLDAHLAVAKGALEKFGSPELTKLLNESGLGNNPQLVKLLYNVGKATSQDTFVSGRQATSPKSAAQTLYPNLN